VRPLFRAIARTGLREIFTAAALALVVGTALLMTQVGLSPALGTFLAGVVLATSEYRHELEGDVEPFKGLLLGLFFISVGATVNFALVAARPLLVLGLVLGVVGAQARDAGRAARGGQPGLRLSLDQRLLVAFALAQVGEFAFVLFAFAERERVLTAAQTAPLVAAVALSMALTPLVLLAYERVVRPRVGTRESAAPARADDAVDAGGEAIIVGFGEFGATVGRLLRANGVPTTVLDVDSDRVELLRTLGIPCTTATRRGWSCSRRRARGGRGCSWSPSAPPKRRCAWRERRAASSRPRGARAGLRVGRRARPRRGGRAARVPRVARHGAAARGRRPAPRGDARPLGAARGPALPPPRRGVAAAAHGRTRRPHALPERARQRIAELEQLLLSDRDRRDDAGRDSGWDAESLREEVRRDAGEPARPAPPPARVPAEPANPAAAPG
jgi:hypothetical protein